ncbi:hypothetical protein BC628DRAFT_1368398 [Trametes gibbosa]|nr:hypothetical protein BC628DRAFT_1368398 [Trametes gibbosa]
MIVDKQPLPGDEVDLRDAPPSYDALDNVPPPLPRSEKPASSPTYPPPAQSPLSPKSPATLSAKPSSKRVSSSWFNFGPSARANKEVRTTIQGLLRDLVKHKDAQGALGVLESCADACHTYELSLSTLLQERTIEGHTPLYWAIINRPTDGEVVAASADAPDVFTALLAYAAPLSDATADELRLACLHTSDHGLFQRLRRSPAFSPLSGADELILGASGPVDDIEVADVPGDEVGFVATFRIPMFQKRMRISQEITLEFIAKGRMWMLKCLVARQSDSRLGYRHARTGSWVVVLSLLPHSPPTWIDSRLVIEDPRTRTHPPPAPDPAVTGPPASLREAVDGMALYQHDAAEAQAQAQTSHSKPKPKIELRMKRSEQLTAPSSTRTTNFSLITASFEEDAHANSLQFKGCPYIESDGSLVARLEARLAQPGAECVIC